MQVVPDLLPFQRPSPWQVPPPAASPDRPASGQHQPAFPIPRLPPVSTIVTPFPSPPRAPIHTAMPCKLELGSPILGECAPLPAPVVRRSPSSMPPLSPVSTSPTELPQSSGLTLLCMAAVNPPLPPPQRFDTPAQLDRAPKHRAQFAPDASPVTPVFSDKGPTPKTPLTKIKGPWSAEEDKILVELVEKYGARKWTVISSHIPGRTGKQARERWLNQLSPNLSKRPWTNEEDTIIMDQHAKLGNKWSHIASLLHGRTDNSVKNRFNTTIRRQISALTRPDFHSHPKREMVDASQPVFGVKRPKSM